MKAQVTSMRLQGMTDLTLMAPIKQGFVDALDTCTYETRLRTLMRTLSALRSSSREYSPTRPFSDTVERIQSIHSFRLAITEPDKNLLLAVTFDRGWEPYIRLIWRDLGTLLDVIFCNCDGYKSAFESGFEEYAAWIRRSQVDSKFFYAVGALSVSDLQYLRQIESVHRSGRDAVAADAAAARLVFEDPQQAALATARGDELEAGNLGLAALNALYRLTDLYPADGHDGAYLLRAAHELLLELRILDTKRLFPPGSPKHDRFKAQLDWFERAVVPRPAAAPDRLIYTPSAIQGGILTSYDRANAPITHGCLVLMQVADARLARAFLAGLAVTTEDSGVPIDGIYVNIAFTVHGLARLGVPADELAKFPKEFREGMEARADLLGDFRSNHPRNWKLPERNWPDRSAGRVVARVQLSAIDIVVQLRTSRPIQPGDHEISGNAGHPLYAKIAQLAGQPQQMGVHVLSVQAMLRRYRSDGSGQAIDRFGFVDGISQPVVDGNPTGAKWNDQVRRGELLCGYRNDRGDGPGPAADGEYLDNGTFLVVRKLAQDVDALNRFLDDQLAKLSVSNPAAALSRDDLLGKMMGRTLDGQALADPGLPPRNDFNYDNDRDGARCPFQAHIRRANPRTLERPTVPRIMRRGMSYGVRIAENTNAERGLIFMAYNAGIAEQFEVLQRWISGGNSSGVFTGQSDPFLGVRQPGDPRTFRFLHGGETLRVDLDSDKWQPFVRLEWGAYLFTPSPAVLQKIAALNPPRAASPADEGEDIIRRLAALDDLKAKAGWKAVLEDAAAKDNGENAAVWAAIRDYHGGVLRTPYGVLVGANALVQEVFANRQGLYSVSGYLGRMRPSIGEIYLGLDQGQTYSNESSETNIAILSVDEGQAFKVARKKTEFTLGLLLDGAEAETRKREAAFDIKKDLCDPVFAMLSKHWFNLPDGMNVANGGWDWELNRQPRCPGDFTSPSRYLFSPNPGPAVERYGQRHGSTLRAAVNAFVAAKRPDQQLLSGKLSNAMFAAIADDDLLARTIVGVMMGFLPTADGCLRSILYEWMQDKSLWRVQEALVAQIVTEPNAYQRAATVLRVPMMRTMQHRPVPDMVWRTAVAPHALGGVDAVPGDKIVVGIVSATQEDLASNPLPNVFAVFGGDRRSANAPTHACPAYSMAMGVLLGMLSALLEAGTLSPTPAPLTLILAAKPGMP